MTPATALEPLASPAPQGGDEPLYEVLNGQRVEIPRMGAYETAIASKLFFQLCLFPRLPQLGQVFAEMLFDLAAIGQQRRPDLAFVSFNRWPRGREVPREAAWSVVPDLAIEVISPTNMANDVIAKIHEFFEAGVLQVWIFWPEFEEIYVYEAVNRIRVLRRNDTLEGGSILPGFQVAVSALFETRQLP